LILILACSTGIISAQSYDLAAGVRAGYSSGLIIKKFIDRDFALEAQGVYNQHGFQFNLLYMYQMNPYPKERLQYYTGLGAYGGNWEDNTAVGIAAVAGAEYIFRGAPVIMGLEWKPFINVYKEFGYAIPDIALRILVKIN